MGFNCFARSGARAGLACVIVSLCGARCCLHSCALPPNGADNQPNELCNWQSGHFSLKGDFPMLIDSSNGEHTLTPAAATRTVVQSARACQATVEARQQQCCLMT